MCETYKRYKSTVLTPNNYPKKTFPKDYYKQKCLFVDFETPERAFVGIEIASEFIQKFNSRYPDCAEPAMVSFRIIFSKIILSETCF